MLNKVNASVKLYMLMFITAASLIGLGLYCISDLKKMDDNTHSLYADRVLPIEQLSDMRFEYAVNIIPVAQKVKDGTLTFAEAQKQVLRSEKIININWHNYELTYLTPEEALLVKQTDVIKSQADKKANDLVAILSKQDKAALDGFIQKGFFISSDPFYSKLCQLMDLQVRVGKEIFSANNELYHSTAKRFFVIILSTLVVALSISFFLTKSIKKLIKNLLHSNDNIKESEEKYHSLFEQASDAIYVVNFKGYFTNVNESMCQMMGYSREELLTMRVDDLLNVDLLKANPLVYSIAKPGDSVRGERKAVHKNGTIIDLEINGKKFNDDRVIVILRDITDRKQMEAELSKAELRFRTLADRSMVGIYIVQKGIFVYVNPRFAEVFGYGPEELIGRPPVEAIIHPHHQSIAAENVRLRMEEGKESVHYEAMGQRKDGNANWVEFYGSRATMEGEPTIIGSMIDITERKKAEDLVRSTQANLQTILNNTDTAYALLNADLDILEYNNKALVFAKNEFNFEPENKGKIFDLMPQDRRFKFLGYISDVFKGNTIGYEVSYPQTDDTHLWYYVRMFPIADKDNRILGLVLAITDITERKDAEESLRSAYDQIKTNIKFIREMVWKQSHVLRSPLANLKGLVNILQNSPDETEVLDHIATELERLDTVIHEMAEDSAKDEMINAPDRNQI